MADEKPWTPTQQRLLERLSDGRPHRLDELQTLLWDDMTTKGTLAVHICNLRKRLRPRGEDIVCEIGGAYNMYRYYRHVRLLASPNTGYS